LRTLGWTFVYVHVLVPLTDSPDGQLRLLPLQLTWLQYIWGILYLRKDAKATNNP